MLYQKHRPEKLSDICGNDSTISALSSVLRRRLDDHPHVYLLFGPSGTGKTTVARILAKEFLSGANIFEYNAADARGIDDIRGIRDMALPLPIGGTTKSFILDECHQITKDADAAILKVLEETPKHCYFFLCTTNPQELSETIRNRCSRYEFSHLSQKEIISALERIVKLEDMDIREEILEMISLSCEGCARDAIVSLEQVMGMEPVDAIDFLIKGTSKDSRILDLCSLMCMEPGQRRKKWRAILNCFGGINDNSEKVRRSMMTYMMNKILGCDDESVAEDLCKTISILSKSTYHGGKPQLCAQVCRIIFRRIENE